MFSRINTPENETKYPCLMVSKSSGTLVFFDRPKSGKVVSCGANSSWSVGDEAQAWVMDEFKPFSAPIELPPKEETEYPCLMIGILTRVLVWFPAGPGVGIVVDPGRGQFHIGQESTSWSMDTFEPFNGSVELSNHKL